MGSTVVAVIDIGSNSIKALAATGGPAGELVTLKTAAIDARISQGIAQVPPRLSDGGMQNGLKAIGELLREVAPLKPARTILVATSAVRDAANGAEFRQRVERATGHAVRLLSGREEADLIGRGLLTDAALAGLRDFYVFDLGGGSLECLAFRDRRAVQVTSLPLGCVRLMEQCVTDPRAPLAAPELARITAAVREVLAKSGFILSLPPDAPAVFTGGTVTTVRAIAAAQSGAPIADTRPLISAAALRGLLEEVAALGLAERRAIRGLAPARADVFPTALAIALAVADAGGFTEFRHSFHNLRYGVAAEALGL